MPHDHADDAPESGGRLMIVVGLNLIITVVEVIGGLLSGSLSLISDALHNFSDGVAVVIAWIAIRLNARPRNEKYTFGLKRAEVVAAVINAGSLVAISIYLFVEAWQRFTHPEPIAGAIMVTVALVGLVANVIGTLLLRRGASKSMNLRATYLHLLSDAVSSVGVVIGGITIMLWNISWIDPLLSVLIGLYVLKKSAAILWDSLETFMLAAPDNIALAAVRSAIGQVPDVLGVHHVHIWRMADSDIHFEAHVETIDQPLSGADGLRTTIETLLYDKFEITHTTLQIESTGCACSSRSLA